MDSTISSKLKTMKGEGVGGMFFGSQHFGGRGVYWSFGMMTRKIDKQFNYSHSR
jgi:hypothetical protein